MSRRKKRLWEDFFEPHILMRGLDYYETGNVLKLERNGDRIDAVVEGTEDYDVRITLQDDQVTGMSCTCPYAESGENCKHMAAVLYELEDETEDIMDDIWDEEPESKPKPKLNEELDALIDSIPDEALRSFVKCLAHGDGYLCGRILSEFQEQVGGTQLDHLKEQVRDICYQYTDDFGSVSWREVSDFVSEMLGVLEDMV